MLTHTSCQQASRGNLTYYAPPCGGGVGGGATILWVRNCTQKRSVNSVCSVREKTPQRFVCVLYHTVVAFFFSQKNTDEQNTRYFTETLSQPISQNLTANRGLTPSPSPNGEGSDHRGYPSFAACVVMLMCSYRDTFIANHQHLTTIT